MARVDSVLVSFPIVINIENIDRQGLVEPIDSPRTRCYHSTRRSKSYMARFLGSGTLYSTCMVSSIHSKPVDKSTYVQTASQPVSPLSCYLTC